MRKVDIVIHKDFELDIEKEAIKGIKLRGNRLVREAKSEIEEKITNYST